MKHYIKTFSNKSRLTLESNINLWYSEHPDISIISTNICYNTDVKSYTFTVTYIIPPVNKL